MILYYNINISYIQLFHLVEKYQTFENHYARDFNYFISIFCKKPKYNRKILCQINILKTKIADLVYQNVYIANILVNFQGLTFTFYEIDLFLKY